jgi:hypothetical protein
MREISEGDIKSLYAMKLVPPIVLFILALFLEVTGTWHCLMKVSELGTIH